jgi:hypothetical protein
MHYTQDNFTIKRADLFFKGIIRPAAIALPTILLSPLWWREGAPAISAPLWLAWAVATLLLLWFAGINTEERSSLRNLLQSRMRMSPGHG